MRAIRLAARFSSIEESTPVYRQVRDLVRKNRQNEVGVYNGYTVRDHQQFVAVIGTGSDHFVESVTLLLGHYPEASLSAFEWGALALRHEQSRRPNVDMVERHHSPGRPVNHLGQDASLNWHVRRRGR